MAAPAGPPAAPPAKKAKIRHRALSVKPQIDEEAQFALKDLMSLEEERLQGEEEGTDSLATGALPPAPMMMGRAADDTLEVEARKSSPLTTLLIILALLIAMAIVGFFVFRGCDGGATSASIQDTPTSQPQQEVTPGD